MQERDQAVDSVHIFKSVKIIPEHTAGEFEVTVELSHSREFKKRNCLDDTECSWKNVIFPFYLFES